jgi:hypothetical protein
VPQGTAPDIGAFEYSSDALPDPFSFIEQTSVALSSEVVSNSIIVNGISDPATIFIAGGQYSINGEALTSSSGTVVNGDSVRVQLLSSDAYSTTIYATLQIGGVTGTFSVTTVPSHALVIAASSGANGNISPSGDISVISGVDQSFTIKPASGYHVYDVLVDGVSVGAVGSYTFSNVTTDHTIRASFTSDAYNNVPALSLCGALLLSAALGGVLLRYGSTSGFCRHMKKRLYKLTVPCGD